MYQESEIPIMMLKWVMIKDMFFWPFKEFKHQIYWEVVYRQLGNKVLYIKVLYHWQKYIDVDLILKGKVKSTKSKAPKEIVFANVWQYISLSVDKVEKFDKTRK